MVAVMCENLTRRYPHRDNNAATMLGQAELLLELAGLVNPLLEIRTLQCTLHDLEVSLEGIGSGTGDLATAVDPRHNDKELFC